MKTATLTLTTITTIGTDCPYCGGCTDDGHHGDGRCPREEDDQLDREYAAWLDTVQ